MDLSLTYAAMNTLNTPQSPDIAPPIRWGARRLAVAAIAYFSVVSGSVAAAAALVNASVPVEVFTAVF